MTEGAAAGYKSFSTFEEEEDVIFTKQTIMKIKRMINPITPPTIPEKHK